MNPTAPSALSPARTAKKETEVAPPLAARSPEWAESVCSMEGRMAREGEGRDIREEEDGGTEASGATDGRRRASELLLSFARSNLKESVVRGHRSVQQASSPPILPSLPSVFLSLTRVEPRCVPQSSNVSRSSAAVLPPPCTLARSQPLDNMLLP